MAHSRGISEKRIKTEGRSIDDAQKFLEEQGYEVMMIALDVESDEYVASVRNPDGV